MTLKDKTIAFIGAGNMAEALIRGILGAKTVAATQVIVTDVRPERLKYFADTFAVTSLTDNVAAAENADVVVLAVKPQQISAVIDILKSKITATKLVISIAAGITTNRLERELGGQPRVVRVMPNTPALIGAGAAGVSAGKFATEEDVSVTEVILRAVGICVRVDEQLMDAVTALSGSGPAYVYLVTEAMVAAGIQIGLSAELAKKLAVQTVWGAGTLMAATGEEPSELRRKVTSPGGTTEAAIKVLQNQKLVESFAEAIHAAARRSAELSGSEKRG